MSDRTRSTSYVAGLLCVMVVGLAWAAVPEQGGPTGAAAGAPPPYQVIEVTPGAEAAEGKAPAAPMGVTRIPRAGPMSGLGPVTVREIEPNGTPGTATPLGGTSAVAYGTVYPNADLDYFSFSGGAGDRVYAAVMTSFSATSTDSTITLYGTDGTTVIETDLDDGSFGSLSSSIAGATLPVAGTYYLQVKNNSATSQLRPYNLYFRLRSGAPTAETEPNDVGQALPGSGWVSGSTSAATDVDLFTMSLNAGDTVFLSLDLDPERDITEWNAQLGLGAFDSIYYLVVNDAGLATPDSEAFFFTVKEAGTYGAYVAVPAGGTTFGTYHLSVTVFPASDGGLTCTTYTSTNVPQTIPDGPGSVSSTITIPGNPRIADLDVAISLTHASMLDLDVNLISPQGNDNGLFNDIGGSTATFMDLVLDDEGAIPIGSFTVVAGMVYQPELNYRLSWFDGENAGGTWTLTLRDDLASNGGTLNGWSIRVCEPAPVPQCASGFTPVTVYSSDFESGDGGFTHSGTQDEWERGTPAFAPITTCNSGTNCWKTDLDNTYNPSSTQDLVSPTFDLTGLTGPVIVSWAQRYQMESASFDHAWVDFRRADDSNPTRLWEWLDATMTVTVGNPSVTLNESAGWGLFTANLSSYAGQQTELVVHLDGDSSVNYAGLAIDDVTVTACQAPVPSISLVKTVGTTPGVCAATTAITVAPGTTVYYCYAVTNTGNVTLNLHNLVDDQLGTLFSGLAYALTPGSSVNTVAAGLSIPAVINATTTNTGTWIAYNQSPPDGAQAQASATVTVINPPNIDVSPLSMASTQLPDTTTSQTLTIGNTGAADLIWEFSEESLAVPAPLTPPPPVTHFDSQAAVETEKSGVEPASTTAPRPRDPAARALARRMLLSTGLLLVPDSTNDRVMALDPTTGNVVDADFIPTNAVMGTAVNAILNASGDGILVSDQTNDVVHEFDLDGTYVGVFAPAGGADTTILDNIRGIALDAGGNLLVTVGGGANDDSIARFDTNGAYLGNFVAIGAGGLASPFDVHGRTADWLVASIDSDNVLRYDLTGTSLGVLATTNNFPEQIAEAGNGNVLVGNFSGTQEGVIELTSAGALVGVYNPATLGGYRGVHELPNGNILTTTGTGVHEINRSGALVESKITGIGGRFIEYAVIQTACTNLVNVPWLSEAPVNGTTPGGTSTPVQVSFDSTGLAPGSYTANLCVFSNDPDPGPGNGTGLAVVPVSLTVEAPPAPAITLVKTVGTTAGVCATTSAIIVSPGTTVYYCYAVTNTGNVTLNLHNLTDDKLGTIFTGLAYALTPGSSVNTVAAGLSIPAVINTTTTNTATWTAYNAGPVNSTQAQASATVTVNINPSITLAKTVGTAAGVCAATSAISVDPGTTVYYCYSVTNTGNVTLNLHNLTDDKLGTIFTGLAYALTPGSSVNTVAAGLSIPAVINTTTTNTATWTAYNAGPVNSTQAQASATVTVNANPSITLAKTVGTVAGVCAATSAISVDPGTTVYYCYSVTNTGNVTLNLHNLTDDQLGTIFTGLAYALTPGSSVNTVAAGLSIPAVINATTTNTATWIAYNQSPTDGVQAQASATVTVTANPSITLTKTVGTVPGVCAGTSAISVTSGTTVYYCYAVTNTGNVTLNLHNLADDKLGTLFTGLAYALTPGSSVNTVAAGLSIPAVITTTTTNTATWTAYNTGPINSTQAQASATVTVLPPADVYGLKTVTGDYTPGRPVTYTVVLTNSGPGNQADNPGDEFSDLLPSTLTATGASATSGAVLRVGNLVTWNGPIPAAGSVTITITATINHVPGGTLITNQGTINFDSDGDGTNNAARVTDDPQLPGTTDPTSFVVRVVEPIPMLHGAGTVTLILLLAGVAIVFLRRIC